MQTLYAETEPPIDQAKEDWQTIEPAAQILIEILHHVHRGSSSAEAVETVRHFDRSTIACGDIAE